MTRKEAIKILQNIYFEAPEVKEALQIAIEALIPELKESDDERIRKTLIEELSACNTVGELKFRLPAPTREECIAYLEKQKEHWKPSEEQMGALKETISQDCTVCNGDRKWIKPNLESLYEQLKALM